MKDAPKGFIPNICESVPPGAKSKNGAFEDNEHGNEDLFSLPMMTLRPEKPCDLESIRSVHRSAFPTETESRLVDLLRARGKALVSLVAQVDGLVAGHVLFSPVVLEAHAGLLSGLGLAPLAVLPSHQRRGIGSSLVREGLEACRREQCPFVVVLGNPSYYQRFGFQTAGDAGLSNEYGATEAFMVLELAAGFLPEGGGLVKYAPEFSEAESGPPASIRADLPDH